LIKMYYITFMLNNLEKNPKLPTWYTKTRMKRSYFWIAIILLLFLLYWGMSTFKEIYAMVFILIIFSLLGNILLRFRVNDISPNSPDEVYKKFRGFGKAKGILLSIGSMPSYTETKGLSEGTKIFGITFKNKDPW